MSELIVDFAPPTVASLEGLLGAYLRSGVSVGLSGDALTIRLSTSSPTFFDDLVQKFDPRTTWSWGWVSLRRNKSWFSNDYTVRLRLQTSDWDKVHCVFDQLRAAHRIVAWTLSRRPQDGDLKWDRIKESAVALFPLVVSDQRWFWQRWSWQR